MHLEEYFQTNGLVRFLSVLDALAVFPSALHVVTIDQFFFVLFNTPFGMLTTDFVACADDGIGKFDTSMLSQQSLMELFIFGLDNVDRICGSRDDPREVCTWTGVTCNADKEISELDCSFRGKDGTGSICLKFLPCSITYLCLYGGALSGTITLSDLPGGMEDISLESNQLSGSLDLHNLPASMREVFLGANIFTGEISLEHLPAGLESLNLEDNHLSGPICLTSLPPALRILDLHQNTFQGSLNVTRLPERLENLHLRKNSFCGEIDIRHLPTSLECLDVRNNRLCADPTKGHLSVVGWTSTPVLGEAKNLFKPLVVFLSWRRPY